MAAEIDDLNRTLDRRGLDPLTVLSREEWTNRQEGQGGSASLAARAAWGLLLGL